MDNKEWMSIDALFLPTGSLRFYYKLRGEEEQHFVDDPDPKWLSDFVSEDKPYEIQYGYPWTIAFEYAIARESSEKIISELQRNGMLTDDDICAIIECTISKYDPRLSECLVINSERYLKYMNFPGRKVWQYVEKEDI